MENSNPKLSEKARGCLWHLGSYIIVIGALGIINLLTGLDDLWFLWPAIGWGVGLAFHFMGVSLAAMTTISKKWRGFLSHLGSYVIIIGMLAMINLLTGLDDLWFLYPAVGWGAGLSIHFLGMLLGTGAGEEERQQREQEREERRQRKRQKRQEREESLGEAEAIPTKRGEKARSRPAEYPLVNKGRVKSTVQTHLDKAVAYQAQIDNFIKATTDANARARLQDLAAQVGEWVEAIEDLAKRLDDFQQNSLIRQDFEAVPQAITDLETRLAQESDPVLRSQLERTLSNRRKQMTALERLQNTMKRAEIQIESTLSSLGTIYSQLLTTQSTDHVADYSHLSAEVEEEVHTLQDHLEALEEVKLSRV